VTPNEGRRPLLPGLQYYRAFAAILVVFYHAAGVFGPGGYYPQGSWESGLMFGHCGVELFFVLSGFIICQVHWGRLGRPGELASYIRKRLMRIYPPVILAVLVFAALRTIGHKPLSGLEWANSLILFPFSFDFAPPVLWTLAFEMVFYVIFLIAFIDRRLFLLCLAAWGISGYLLCVFTEYPHVGMVHPLLGSAYTFLFGLGAAVFLINRRIGKIPGGPAIALSLVALAIFVIGAWLDVRVQSLGLARGPELEIAARKITPLFGVAGAMWILVLANTGFGLRGAAHRILFFLGNASYAIYLWHLIVQRVLSYALGRLGLANTGTRAIAILLLVGGGIALGSLVYALIEKPMLRRINGWFSRRGL